MPESGEVIVVGIICNKCGYEFPPHTMTKLLDVKFMETFHTERHCEKILLNKMCKKK